MFFEVNPSRAVLSDVNYELVNAYLCVRDYPEEVVRRLKRLSVSEEIYYSIRASRPDGKIDKAVRLIYLNRTCFNGIYRTNRRGEFNVPYGGGTRTHETLLREEYILKSANRLRYASVVQSDFESQIDASGRGDVIYCDPAYTVAHGNNGFVRYNETIFSWKDQIRLKNASLRAVSRGATVVISNAAHQSIARLFYPYRPITVYRQCSVGGRKGRGEVAEYIFVMSLRRKDRQALSDLLSKKKD